MCAAAHFRWHSARFAGRYCASCSVGSAPERRPAVAFEPSLATAAQIVGTRSHLCCTMCSSARPVGCEGDELAPHVSQARAPLKRKCLWPEIIACGQTRSRNVIQRNQMTEQAQVWQNRTVQSGTTVWEGQTRKFSRIQTSRSHFPVTLGCRPVNRNTVLRWSCELQIHGRMALAGHIQDCGCQNPRSRLGIAFVRAVQPYGALQQHLHACLLSCCQCFPAYTTSAIVCRLQAGKRAPTLLTTRLV